MPNSFHTRRRVEFRDTDAAGIAHFSRFFTWMEEVEHEFLRSLGTSVVVADADGAMSWPRVSAQCDYQGPLRFENEFEVQLTITRIGAKSVTYAFEFLFDGRPIANGQTTVVCCRIVHGQPPRSIPIPDQLSKQLAAYLHEPASD